MITNLLFFLFHFKLCFSIEYKKINKNVPTKINLSSEQTRVYTYLSYTEDYEEEDKDKINKYYFLLIDSRLKILCYYKNIENETQFPDEKEFKISSYSCKEIELNSTHHIIQYNKTEITMINLFMFSLKSYSVSEKEIEIKRLSFPKRLNEGKNIFTEKETKIFFFTILKGNYGEIIFFTDLKNYSLFYEKEGIYNYIKDNSFGINPFYVNYYNYKNATNKYYLLIYQNIKNEEEYLNIEIRNKEKSAFGKIKVINGSKLNNTFIEKCYLNFYYIIYSTRNSIINIHGNNLYYLKHMKTPFKKIDDVNNFSNYDNIYDNQIISSNDYETFYIRCPHSSHVTIQLDFINSTLDTIYFEKFSYFKIEFNISIPIHSINNELIILKLLSKKSENVIINSKEYYFNPEEKKILDLKGEEYLTIINKQSELLFGIKKKIPDNLIKIIDYSEQEYQLETTYKQKFIIFKFDDYENNFINFTLKKYSKNKIYYYQQSGYKELNDIGIQTLKNLENLNIQVDLKLYKINNNEIKKENKVYYQFFYFSNIENNTNISIITNKIERIEIPSDKYIKLNEQNYLKIFKLYEEIIIHVRFFIIVCSPLNKFNISNGSYLHTFSNNDAYSINQISSLKLYFSGEGYLFYHIKKEGEYDYEYSNYNGTKIEFFLLNNTHFTYKFQDYNLFSNASEFNYIASITELKNEKYINSTCDTFENLYMNPINNSDITLYNFSSKDIVYNSSYSLINLPIPSKLKSIDKNVSLVIRVIRYTSKIHRDIIFFDKIYYDFTPIKEFKGRSHGEWIFIIFLIIIFWVVILIVFLRKRMKNDDLKNQFLISLGEKDIIIN